MQETGRAVFLLWREVFKGAHSFNHATDAGPGSPAKSKRFGVRTQLFLGTFLCSALVQEINYEENTLEKTLRRTYAETLSMLSDRLIILCNPLYNVSAIPSTKSMSFLSSCSVGLYYPTVVLISHVASIRTWAHVIWTVALN